MEQDAIRVRKGATGDARQLAQVGAETFYDSYVDQMDADVLATYVARSFAPDVQAAELADGASSFLIAESVGAMLGYARLYQGQAPEAIAAGTAPDLQRALAGQRALEIQRLYVRQPWIGRGVGAALMRACLQEAQAQACDVLWLGVWERNTRAMRFYEKWGFETVGEQSFVLGAETHRDVLMRRFLISRSQFDKN